MARMTHDELLAKRANMTKYDAHANTESIRKTGRDLRGKRAKHASDIAKKAAAK